MHLIPRLLGAVAALSLVAVAAPDADALNPSRTYKVQPEKYNMVYKQAKVTTNDGQAELNVWDFAPKGERRGPPVLLVHSGEGNMADFLRRVEALTSAGRPVVIFDYRGFGESSEFEIDTNMYLYPHFIDDVKTMFDYVRKAHVAVFDVYGWGIGGGLALGVGWGRPETRRIVADTPFLSMEDLETRFSPMDEPMEVPFAGYDKRHEPLYSLDTSPGKHLQRVVLIIGSNDVLYRAADMKSLIDKQKELVDKDVFVVENPDRKDNFRVATPAYTAKLLQALGGS